VISKIVQSILNVFRFHKLKVFLFLLATIAFAIVIFPYGDLSDYVTTQIAQATNQQVYVRFEDLNIKFIPAPGVEMSTVSVETPYLPRLTVSELSVWPSIAGLLAFKPGVSVEAAGLWGGEVFLSTRGGGKTDSGNPTQVVRLDTAQVSLQDFSKALKLPLPLKGELTMNSNTTVDPQFGVQPEGDISMQVDRFQIVAANVPTSMGPINVPEVKISSLTMNGRISDSRFIIEEGRLGKEGDDVSGSLKGDIGLKFNQGLSVVPGAYNLDVDVTVSKGLIDRAGLLLILLDGYKRPAPGGAARYAVRIQGDNFFTPPRISSR
jgi:type II secretion system protein N